MERQTATKNKQESINSSSLSRGILQRKCACGNQSAGGGECGECGKNKQLLQRRATHISEPGDRYEQEADRIADEVMRMPEPTAKHQVGSEKEGVLQRKAIANSITPLQSTSTGHEQLSEVPPIVDEVLRSPGEFLDSGVQTFMGSRFGYDFSNVRVHTDPKSAESAQSVNAEAYTVGQHIVFGIGHYAPISYEGRKLLAHELAHTVQQTERSWLARNPPDWPAWHQDVLKEISKIAGNSDEKVADNNISALLAYLCSLRLDKVKSGSLQDRFGRGSDEFAKYVKNKFPANYERIIAFLKDLALDKKRPECAPPEEKQATPEATPTNEPPTLTNEPRPPQHDPNEFYAQPYDYSKHKKPPGDVGLPAIGTCDRLKNGVIKYSLVPEVGKVGVRIEFIPNTSVAATSKTISFIQTVLTPFFNGGRTEVDDQDDPDPFYGAKWERSSGKWQDEPTATQVKGTEGSSPFTASTGKAILNDSPMLNINETKKFNTVAVVIETGAVLGSLSWTILRKSNFNLFGFLPESSSTRVQDVTCSDVAFTDFHTIVKNSYSDNSRNFVIDDFTSGSADLPVTHVQKLAPIIAMLSKNPKLRVVVGGAATQDEAEPISLSRLRADRVVAYLISNGVDKMRIDEESYGSEWARVPITSLNAANANRRVQIRLL